MFLKILSIVVPSIQCLLPSSPLNRMLLAFSSASQMTCPYLSAGNRSWESCIGLPGEQTVHLIKYSSIITDISIVSF
ncbi:hypothetical protein BDV25DRAFT_157993 [Aspergillus avenaceus]|uniref:Uncharacterized protein n=1 Tax=Aspergillus avenaceus TaxID=36643 RepID=A0A5N6TQE3_ASPAV|nr:hypothetical protein BDV25DRAFT_157993 [Aspergillus avenaceus]